MRFYEEVVRLGGGVLKGEFMLNGFITIKPENEIAKHLQLLNHIRDEEHVARHRAFEDWFKHTQDIPGDFYLWIVQRLFRDNALVRGELEIDGRRVDLRAIRCPVNLLAGATDHITPPTRCSRSRTPSPRRARTSSSASRAAGTSASSWAARRCATTGRRSSPACTSAPARSPHPPLCDRRHTCLPLAESLLIC
jgi:poly(3-hydroxyalkanoate) synthetase